MLEGARRARAVPPRLRRRAARRARGAGARARPRPTTSTSSAAATTCRACSCAADLVVAPVVGRGLPQRRPRGDVRRAPGRGHARRRHPRGDAGRRARPARRARAPRRAGVGARAAAGRIRSRRTSWACAAASASSSVYSLDRMCATTAALYDQLAGGAISRQPHAISPIDRYDGSTAGTLWLTTDGHAAPGALLVGALPPPSGGVATHCRELQRALAGERRATSSSSTRAASAPTAATAARASLARLALARAARASSSTSTPTVTTAAAGCSPRCAPPATPARSLLTLHSGLAPAYIRAPRAPVRASSPRATPASSRSTPRSPRRSSTPAAAERIVVAAAFSPSSLAFRLPPPGLAQIRARASAAHRRALAPGPRVRRHRAARRLRASCARAAPTPASSSMGPGTREPALAAAARAAASTAPVASSRRAPARRARSPSSPPPTSSCAPRSPTATPSACAKRWRSAARWSPPPSALARRGRAAFPPAIAAACAEQIFQSLSKRLPEICASGGLRTDCFLRLYARLDAAISFRGDRHGARNPYPSRTCAALPVA